MPDISPWIWALEVLWGLPSLPWSLPTFLLIAFHVPFRRKTVTAWDTAIAPLDGEELIVEVLEDVPLTMHNFVSAAWTEGAGHGDGKGPSPGLNLLHCVAAGTEDVLQPGVL